MQNVNLIKEVYYLRGAIKMFGRLLKYQFDEIRETTVPPMSFPVDTVNEGLKLLSSGLDRLSTKYGEQFNRESIVSQKLNLDILIDAIGLEDLGVDIEEHLKIQLDDDSFESWESLEKKIAENLADLDRFLEDIGK